MPPRELPARPHLDHLKNEAKALKRAFLRGKPEAEERVRSAIGARDKLKLTEAQRILAREYGFSSWAKLRTHGLLAHGADPNVPCGPEQESPLQVAVRRGQSREVVRLLLDHGADVKGRRGDGYTPWALAERGGFEELKRLLEQKGAVPEPLSPKDELLAACARGNEEEAGRRTTAGVLASLELSDLCLVVEAAGRGRLDIVRACLAAGFPVNLGDEIGATALHTASIGGHAAIVRELLERGADFRIRDRQHDATPLDWACFGADFRAEPSGNYEACVQELLEAGARPTPGHYLPQHEAVREALKRFLEA